MPGCQFALTLNRAETYFWSEPLKEKNKQTTPLKRPFGQCSVADECRKHRSAHIENTHAGHNSRCVKSFSAQRAKAKLGQNTRVGEVAMASTLILGSSTTAEVAQNAHNAGNTWCKVAILSAHWSPLHWHRIMQAKEKQTENRGGSPACVGPSPLPAIRLFIDSGQWAANRSYWCTVSPCSEHQVTASSYKENLVSNPKSNLEARKTFAKKDPHLVSELWLFFKMHASIFQNSSHIQQHW